VAGGPVIRHEGCAGVIGGLPGVAHAVQSGKSPKKKTALHHHPQRRFLLPSFYLFNHHAIVES